MSKELIEQDQLYGTAEMVEQSILSRVPEILHSANIEALGKEDISDSDRVYVDIEARKK